MNRHRAREAVLRVLYEAEVGRTAVDDILARDEHTGLDDAAWRFAVQLARGAWDQRDRADEIVARLAVDWSVDRLARIDLNILRLAIYELETMDTPPKVVVDEAVELAKAYGTEESSRFINGVLGSVLRERERLVRDA
jgi:N utilization substance protein B